MIAVSATDDDVAITRAEPLARAVTLPVASTVTIALSGELHATGAPFIAAPPWFRTSADKVTLASIASSVACPG
jgi:hypothetical protein